MQCEKLNINVDSEQLLIDLQYYIQEVTKIADKWPDDIIRVMCNYPSGTSHYTSHKRKGEKWDIIENDHVKLYTRYTKFGTRMVSAYLKKEDTISPYVKKLIKTLGVNGKVQVAIVYAGSKFRLEKHIDTMGLTRYHIPLTSNKDSYFEIFESEKKFYPKPGEIWKLDTSKEHAANNDSLTHSRIHLIVDFLDE